MSEREPIPESGFDVVVIGGGVIGLAAAAALARDDRSLLVLERATRIAEGITSRNSEVVHAGIYYPAGSRKAEFCVRGRDRLYAWCSEKRVEARRLGKLIVATEPGEETILEELQARGSVNGARGLELIDAAEIARLEPEVRARRALHSPETGIVDGQAFCLSLLAAATAQGGVLAVERNVLALTPQSFGWRIDVGGPNGSIERIDAGFVVDAAGLDADRIAELAGLEVDRLGWRQHYCKGDYFSLAPSTRLALGRLIYPVPQRAGLGIHATLDLAGRVRFGPDAEYIEEIGYEVDGQKAEIFRAAAERYLPCLREAVLRPDYAGIRPKLAGPGEGFRDFVVEETSSLGAAGFVACLGIESPGLTAALAIAAHVAELHSD